MSAPASQLAEAIVLRDGSPALMRAIRPDDRERLQTAFLALDPESVYLRYFVYKRELTEADLDRLCNPDFFERVVLVVTVGPVPKKSSLAVAATWRTPRTTAHASPKWKTRTRPQEVRNIRAKRSLAGSD
jgi:hypothetical protein